MVSSNRNRGALVADDGATAVGPKSTAAASLRNAAQDGLPGIPDEVRRIGRYSIVCVLGQGGMGTVYEAHDDRLDRRVALKLVRGIETGEARHRMVREAQAMARLSHPNVVSVFEVGEHEGHLFIAMEYVDGVPLDAWLQQDGRSWSAVLAKFVEAGVGLMAAHAADLIHRDFKPPNVLVGADGRPRVLDFGLAAQRGDSTTQFVDSTEVPRVTPKGLDTPLTETGTTMGTPAYMAPEQAGRGRADHRSDQFAFCVSLWEALYGALPFTGETMAQRFGNIARGAFTEPKVPAGCPRRLRNILERGMSMAAEDRWPDLATLLAQLRRLLPGARSRRRGLVVVASVLPLTIAGFFGVQGYAHYEYSQREAGCLRIGADEAAELWNETARGRVRQGLLSTGVGYARTTADNTVSYVDAYVANWQAARAEACLATHRAQWDGDTPDRALRCLQHRAMGLNSLVAQLAAADATAANKAVSAAAGLPRVEPCVDAQLLSRLPPPSDLAVRASIEPAYERLSQANAMRTTARYEEGLAAAHDALTLAQSLEVPTVAARARRIIGSILAAKGDYAEAEKALEAAYFDASTAGNMEERARASISLVFVVGSELARPEDGHRWSRHAEAALTALGVGPDDPLRSLHLNNLGTVHKVAGEFARARAAHEQALAIRQSVFGPAHPEVAASLNNLGGVHRALGVGDQAKDCYQRAAAIWESTLGSGHPGVGDAVNNLAGVHYLGGEYDDAKTQYARAVSIWQSALGPDHPKVATGLSNLGVVHYASGDLEAAKDYYERALEVLDVAFGPDHAKSAVTVNALGAIYWATGDVAQARARYERALAMLEKTLGPTHPEVAAVLTNLGEVHDASGDRGAAKRSYERAIAIQRESLGPEHPDLAYALAGLAAVHAAQGDGREALRLLDQAVGIFELREGTQPGELQARKAFAEALVSSGGDRARAVVEATKAADGYRAAGQLAELADVEAWLAGIDGG